MNAPANDDSNLTVSWVSYILHLIVAVSAVAPGGQMGPALLVVALIIDLVKKGDVSGWEATHFSFRIRTVLWAAVLYLITLPLWLIPGLAFVLPVGWLAWFNARTLTFDALTSHADDTEIRTLRRRYRGSFFVLGAVGALMAHIPILGFFAASFTALMFAVAGLEVLSLARGQRDGAGEVVEGEVIISGSRLR